MHVYVHRMFRRKKKNPHDPPLPNPLSVSVRNYLKCNPNSVLVPHGMNTLSVSW